MSTTRRRVAIGIKTSPQAVDWPTLEAAWARIGEHDVFDSRLDERPPDRHRRGAGGPVVRGVHRDGRARPPRPGQVARPRACCRPRSATRRCSPRRRPSRPRRPAAASSSASAPAGSTPSTRRSASRSRRCPSGSTGSSRPSTCSGRCSRPRRATDAGVTRADPFYPLVGATNDPPPLTAGRPADLARRPEAARDRARGRGRRGLAPARPSRADKNPTDMTYFADGATRSWPRWRRSGATRRRSRSRPRCRPARPPTTRAAGLAAAQEAVRLGATHVILGMPPRLGAAGVDEVVADGRGAVARGASDDGHGATRRRRRGSRDDRSHRQRVQPGGSDLGRGDALGRRDLSRRRADAGRARRRRRRRRRPSGGSTCTRPSSTATGATIDVLPDARRAASAARCWSPSRTVAGEAGKAWLHIPATEARPDGIAFLAHRGFVEFERAKTVRLDLAGLEPPTPRATRRHRHHHARRATRARRGRPRGRGRGVRRHPAATSPWPPATWPSSAPATSIDRRSRRGAFAVAIDAGRCGRRLRQPDHRRRATRASPGTT